MEKDSIPVQVGNESADRFFVSMASRYKIPESSDSQPEKLLVISDIEGNYSAFSNFLMPQNYG